MTKLNRWCTAFLSAAGLAAAISFLPAAAQAMEPRPRDAHPPLSRDTWFKHPSMQAFIQYLRCEGDQLNEFGESKPPEPSVFDLPDLEAWIASTGTLPVEVWPGLRGEFTAEGGYGFFVTLQYYPRSSLDALLRAMTAAGWTFKRTSNHPSRAMRTDGRGVRDGDILKEVVAVHTAERPWGEAGQRTRRLVVIEARVGAMADDLDLNGLTVACTYSPARKPPTGGTP